MIAISDGELLEVCGTSLLFLHTCLSQQGEAHDSFIARMNLEAKMSPSGSKDKDQDNSVEAAKSCYANVPTSEVKRLGTLCRCPRSDCHLRTISKYLL